MVAPFLLSLLLSQAGVRVLDEGDGKGRATIIDCTGAGITCSQAGGTATINVTGGGATGYQTVKDEGTSLTQRTTVDFAGAGVTCVDSGGTKTLCTIPGGGGVDLSGEKFIVQQASANLSAEQALGALGTGILKNTTTTGVLSIAVAGDFPTLNQNTTGTAAALTADPADCASNTFATAIAATGALTCAGLTDADVPNSITVNLAAAATALAADPAACSAGQYVTDQNASGTLTCAQVTTAQLSGTVSIAQGGTTETASTEDAVLVGASTTDWQPKVLPSCSNASTSKLLYDSSTNTFSCGTDQTGGGGGGTSPLILVFGSF